MQGGGNISNPAWTKHYQTKHQTLQGLAEKILPESYTHKRSIVILNTRPYAV